VFLGSGVLFGEGAGFAAGFVAGAGAGAATVFFCCAEALPGSAGIIKMIAGMTGKRYLIERVRLGFMNFSCFGRTFALRPGLQRR